MGGATVRVAHSAGRPGLAAGTPLAPGRTRLPSACASACAWPLLSGPSAGFLWQVKLLIHVDVFNRCHVRPAISERPCARHRSPLARPQAAAAWHWERVVGLPVNATILESGISMRPASGEGLVTSLAAWTGAQYYTSNNGRLVKLCFLLA